MWPAGGGEPDPIEHTDDNLTWDPDAFPDPGPGRQPGITRDEPMSRADIVLHHMTASTCHSSLARCPGKTPGADLVAAAGQRRA